MVRYYTSTGSIVTRYQLSLYKFPPLSSVLSRARAHLVVLPVLVGPYAKAPIKHLEFEHSDLSPYYLNTRYICLTGGQARGTNEQLLKMLHNHISNVVLLPYVRMYKDIDVVLSDKNILFRGTVTWERLRSPDDEFGLLLT